MNMSNKVARFSENLLNYSFIPFRGLFLNSESAWPADKFVAKKKTNIQINAPKGMKKLIQRS